MGRRESRVKFSILFERPLKNIRVHTISMLILNFLIPVVTDIHRSRPPEPIHPNGKNFYKVLSFFHKTDSSI